MREAERDMGDSRGQKSCGIVRVVLLYVVSILLRATVIVVGRVMGMICSGVI
jgi:hypothetical protein